MADPSPNASTSPARPHVLPGHEPYSYSRLNRFTQCPLSFRLHYIDRLPAEVGVPLQFGKVLHRVQEDLLREHVRNNRIGPLDRAGAAVALRSNWANTQLNDHALFQEGHGLLQSWIEREGVVDYREVLGIEQDFDIRVGPYRLIGAMDRVDRIGEDAVRVRDYKSSRLPPNRRDVEESLQLAIYDLAARQLWPWAKRVEVGLDLLRHRVLLTTERSDGQREATRQFVLATIWQIAQAAEANAYPARLSPLCVHCDHRSQCSAYGNALATKQTTFVCADTGDLVAVSREREELAALLKVLGSRKEELDAVLTANLREQNELALERRRYTITTSARKEYALDATLDALADVGVPRARALAQLGTVDGRALKRLVDELADRVPRERLLLLRATLDAKAKHSLSSRLTVREPRS